MENIGLDSDEKKFTFIIQNYLHNKNTNRRSAFEEKTYKNPFDQKQAIEFIRLLINNVINEEIKKQVNVYINKVKSNCYYERALKFAKTNDIDEAAKIFDGTYIGVDIKYFYEALIENNSPLFSDKVNMMLTGRYNNKILYRDKDRQIDPTWNMCKKKRNKLGILKK